jgi:hypothetical protein
MTPRCSKLIELWRFFWGLFSSFIADPNVGVGLNEVLKTKRGSELFL